MTNQEIIDYYADLLIIQYKNKAKARAHVQAIITPLIMEGLALSVMSAFDIETAVGVQLDVIGKYAGVSRTVTTFTSRVELGDDDFRLLIKLKNIQNNSESTLYEIDNLIQEFLPGVLSVFDNRNMSMSYFMNASLGSQDLAEAFVVQGLLPRPMAVQLSSLIYAANLDNVFGMRTYTIDYGASIVGLNDYVTPRSDTHWLGYSDALSI